MKTLILLLISVISYCNLFAQNDTLKLSLPQAVQVGLENRYDIKISRLNINTAEIKKAKSYNELVPDLSANGKVTYYTNVQPNIIPEGVLGFTEPHKVQMGMKNNTAFSLDLSYTVYKPGLYTDIKIAENNLKLEQEKNKKTEFDISLEISEAYYNTLLKKLQYDIAVKNEQRYKEYYILANGKNLIGTITKSDVMRSELDYKNSQANTEKLRQNYILSVQYLKYQMNIPGNSVIILTDSLDGVRRAITDIDDASEALANRFELRQLNIEQEGLSLQMKKTRQNFLPSLSIIANYTYLFQGPEFNYSDNFFWCPVNYVGAKISLPITGSFKNTSNVKENRLKSSQSDMMIKQKTADIQYEVQQSASKLINAEKNLQVARDNFLFSEELYELNKQQYDLGSFSYERLLDTEKSLNTAEQEYITAVYNYLLESLNYKKATGIY